MKKFYLPLLLLVLGSGPALGSDLEERFTAANQVFAAEGPEAAIPLYEELASEFNVESPSLFYNLGLAGAKSQDWALAVWGFEKALRTQPPRQLQGDAEHNLELARQSIREKHLSGLENQQTQRSLTVDNGSGGFGLIPPEDRLPALALGLGLIALAFLWRGGGKLSFYGVGMTGLYFTVFAWSAIASPDARVEERLGVITETSRLLEGSHGSSAPISGKIVPGQMVRLIDESHPEFVRVWITAGEDGWLPKAAVREL